MKHWDNYQIILALHEASTIRGAAALLGVNHSTVSRRLIQIERKLPSPLFEKTPSGYSATALGLVMVEHAREMKRVVYASERQLNAFDSDLSGDLSLSIPDALGQYLLLDDLAKFCAAFPLINLTVISSYKFADLDHNEADIVIRGTANPPNHLVGRRLFPYSLCLYANKDYFRNTAREDLRWICAPFGNKRPSWTQDTPYSDVAVGMQLGDITLRHMALINGHGIGRGACYMADIEPKLMRLPGAEPTPAEDLWVLTHPDRRNTPKVKKLMTFLCDAIKAKRGLIKG